MLTKAKKRKKKKKEKTFVPWKTNRDQMEQAAQKGKVLSTHWKKKGVQFGK